jgi:vacuolar protein sorting-associated protein 54
LQVHQDEIHTKLITIMDDRLKAHARTFDKLNWETVPDGKQVHPYAETIVTETSTLHNVLRRYLSPMVVEVLVLDCLLMKDDYGWRLCELYFPFE